MSALTAFVGCVNAGHIIPIDITSNTIGAPIASDGGFTVRDRSLAITPDGTTCYVAGGGLGSVAYFDVATETPIGSFAVGTSPVSLAITPDGTKMYVLDVLSSTTGQMWPVSLPSHTVGSAITLAGPPGNMAVAPDGVMGYVTIFSNISSVPCVVTPVTIASNALGSNITVGDVAVTAIGALPIAITPDSKKAFVGLNTGSYVTPLDLTVPSAGATFAITSGLSPVGLAIDPTGTTCYVAGGGGPGVCPITVATNAVGSSFTGGIGAAGLALTPDGTELYVCQNYNGTVQAIAIPSGTSGTLISIGGSTDSPTAIVMGPAGYETIVMIV